jgi:hypothetical protein
MIRKPLSLPGVRFEITAISSPSITTKQQVNATYAAGFGASTKIFRDLDERRIRLANGIVAHFSPVSCGGSCAPANLWWVQNGVEYQIQIKFGSAEKKEVQERLLVETANSCVPAPKKRSSGAGN